MPDGLQLPVRRPYQHVPVSRQGHYQSIGISHHFHELAEPAALMMQNLSYMVRPSQRRVVQGQTQFHPSMAGRVDVPVMGEMARGSTQIAILPRDVILHVNAARS